MSENTIQFGIVLVTASSEEEAQTIARSLLFSGRKTCRLRNVDARAID